MVLGDGNQPIGFIIFLISSLVECERLLPCYLQKAEEELYNQSKPLFSTLQDSDRAVLCRKRGVPPRF